MKLTLIDLRYEVTLCKECITWATEEKRIFLRQALEARLIGLYYDTGNYQVRNDFTCKGVSHLLQAALADGAKLLKELKKLDDKNLLVEVGGAVLLGQIFFPDPILNASSSNSILQVQLLESKTYHALSNLPRARAALTSARTTANSIYVPPRIQV